jgi:hypothetical protein
MARRAKKQGTDKAGTQWWIGTYVVARLDPDGDFCPHNTYWRLALNDHEAQMGLEEWTKNEPVWLSMTEREAQARAALKDQNQRRMFDVRLRMMMRCGQKPQKPDDEYVRVESTPFPCGWSPTKPSAAVMAPN